MTTTVVALTGGIGSGKSTVAQILAELGAKVIDIDKLAHKVYEPGSSGYHDTVAAFGTGILRDNGEIDRAKLGQIVFNNPKALKRLNDIIHTKMLQMNLVLMDNYKREGVDVVVYETPLIFEMGWPPAGHEIWTVAASEEVALQHLTSRPNLSRDQALARIRTQFPNEERIRRSDVAIYNNGNIDELRAAVRKEWEALHKRNPPPKAATLR